MVKNLSAMPETWACSLGGEDPWRREWFLTPVFLPGEFHGQRSQLWCWRKLLRVPWTAGMVFPVVMCGCESWTIKKAEPQRIDAFELWYWRRLLRVPWTARRSNQSILTEFTGRTDVEAETPILWPPHAK